MNNIYNSNILVSTLVGLIIIVIILYVIRFLYPDFKMRIYAKGHINNLNGKFNIENFSSEWKVRIPAGVLCPPGTKSRIYIPNRKNDKFDDEICCISYSSNERGYKNLPYYNNYKKVNNC